MILIILLFTKLLLSCNILETSDKKFLNAIKCSPWTDLMLVSYLLLLKCHSLYNKTGTSNMASQYIIVIVFTYMLMSWLYNNFFPSTKCVTIDGIANVIFISSINHWAQGLYAILTIIIKIQERNSFHYIFELIIGVLLSLWIGST